MVPFALFVSLSANDNVLPTTVSDSHLAGDQDVVSNYFSRGKKQGLLSLFNYLKNSIMPGRNKKSFWSNWTKFPKGIEQTCDTTGICEWDTNSVLFIYILYVDLLLTEKTLQEKWTKHIYEFIEAK